MVLVCFKIYSNGKPVAPYENRVGGGEPQNSDLFRFKIGDMVITRTSRNIGIVVSGVCFNGFAPNRVFYQIQLENGKRWTMMEDTIESYPTKTSATD